MQALSRMTLETSLGFVCAVRCGRAFSVLGSIQLNIASVIPFLIIATP